MAVDDEDSYFSSYSHYSIHEEMLKVPVVFFSRQAVVQTRTSIKMC